MRAPLLHERQRTASPLQTPFQAICNILSSTLTVTTTYQTDSRCCCSLQHHGRCTTGMQTPCQQWRLQQQQLGDCPPAQLRAQCISQAACTSLALRPMCKRASAMLPWRSFEQPLRGLLWRGIGRSSMRRVILYWPW